MAREEPTRRDAANDAIASLMAAPAALASELAEFGARRLHANAERFKRLAAVRSPNDYIDAELRFASDTLGAYAEEAVKLQDIVRGSPGAGDAGRTAH